MILLGCLCLAAEFGISFHCSFKGIGEPMPWRSYFEFGVVELVRCVEFGLFVFVPIISGVVLIAYHHGFADSWRSACKIVFAFLVPVLIWSVATLCLGAGSDTQGPGEKPPPWLTQPLIQVVGWWWWILVFVSVGFWWLSRDMKRAVGHGIPLAFWKVYETPETLKKFVWLACSWSIPFVWIVLKFLTPTAPPQ
ncbi:MAG: hypothetical protein H7Y17_15575 [Chlorobia bacterium]|nr:hypothetical protein [Fimbriimonadaceae bacterium]